MESKLKDLIINNKCELAITLMLCHGKSISDIVQFIIECIDLNNIWSRVDNEGEILNRKKYKIRCYSILEDKLLIINLISQYRFIIYTRAYGDLHRLEYSNKILNEEECNHNRIVFRAKVKQRIESQLTRDIHTKFRDVITELWKKKN